MVINFYDYVVSILDYFEKGIVFCDILLLMVNGEVFKQVIDEIVNYVCDKYVDMVVGLEVWGFIVGCLVVYEFGVGFVLVCKKGKLFWLVVFLIYDLEYGLVIL